MTDRVKTFVSVDRTKLKEDRATGTRQGVIRVQRGAEASFATEVEILGPSHVKYNLHPPQGVPNVWVETAGEVRLDGNLAAPAEMPPQPARPASLPVMSRFLQTSLLEQVIRKIESDLSREPNRADLWRRFGDVQRQAGHHAAALAAYETLLSMAPGDLMVHRLVAILKGHDLSTAPWPEPFVIDSNFVPADKLADLLAFTATQREAFAPTPVLDGGKPSYRPDVRWCTNVWNIERVSVWLEPLIHARLSTALRQLGIPEQPLEIRDSKITHYGDGGFFGPHVDRGPGAETRVLGFILYFYFPPKRFTGGGLAIYDRDLRTGGPATSCTTIIPEQNQLVLLGSDCWHEVVPVSCPRDQWDTGRFTYNGWICRTT